LSSHTDPKVPYYTKVNETAPLSGSKKANFIAGSIVFTQASLLDSPSRYWSLVEDALAEVALTPFQPQESSDTFYRTRLECPNRGATPDGEPFREFTINPNKSSVFVVGGAKPTEGGLRINAWFDVRIRCRYSIRVGVCAFSFLCFNVCDLRDSIVTTSFSNIVPISINITFDPATTLLAVVPKVALKLDFGENFQMSCAMDRVAQVSPLVKLRTGSSLEDKITGTVERAFNDVVGKDILLPQEYRASENMLIGYRIANLTFHHNSHIQLALGMNVSAVYAGGLRRYYEFPSGFHDLVPPSADFSLLLKDKTSSPLLNGMRVSADFLTAISGVTAMIYADFANTTRISDANITYNVSIAGPELSIPEANSIQATFPFGRLYAVCGSEPNVGKELLNINFDDINARVGIEYLNGDPTVGLRPGIVLQYQSLNVSGTRIEVKSPKFPLDGDVLQRALAGSLANRQQYINDILRENPVQLPPQLLPYFPHPRVSATAVRNAGGYFEMLTSCRCDLPAPDLSMQQMVQMGTTSCRAKSCSECVRAGPRCGWCDRLGSVSELLSGGSCEDGLLCGGVTRALNDSSKCPTLSGGYDDGCRFKCADLQKLVRRSAPADEHFDAMRRDADAAAAAAAAVPAAAAPVRADDAATLLRKRAGAAFLVSVYSTRNCSMSRPGSRLAAVALPETDGRCERSQGVFDLSSEALGPFYSIKVGGPGNVTARLMCGKTCAQCSATVSGADALRRCTVGQDDLLSVVLQENAGACFGGLGGTDSSALLGVYSVVADERCSKINRSPQPLQEANDTQALSVVSLGPRSAAAQLRACTDLNRNDVFKSSFARIEIGDASVDKLAMECKNGCVNCEFEINAPFALRTCHTSEEMKKAAIEQKLPDKVRSVFVTDVRTCTFATVVDPRANATNATAATPAPTADPLGDTNQAVLGISIAVAVLVCLALIYGIIQCPKHSGVIDPGHGGLLPGFKAFLRRHSWTFGRPTPGFVWLFVFNAFAIVLAVIELLVWTLGHAIELVDANFLSSTLNVNVKYDSYVNAGNLSSRFAVWLRSGTALLAVVIAVLALLLVDNMVTRHHDADAPDKPKVRNLFGLRMRKSVWFIVLGLHVAMLLVLPLQSTFGVTDSVEFDAQGDETLGKAKGFIEQALGYATGLYMFNVVLNMFTNLLQLIPAGMMCGTVLYLADKGESVPDTRGAVVGRGVWVTAALVCITAHLIIPVALSASVLIFLHRRGMAASFWVGIVWLVQWIAGLLLSALAFFRRVVPAPDRKGHVLVQSHVYFYAYLVVLILTTLIEVFHMVASSTELNFNVFLVLYRVVTFMLVACFTRVWLQAYRPKYTRAALKERREKEHIDAAQAEIDEKAPEPSRTERALAPVGAILGKIGGYAALPVMGPVFIVSYLIEVGRPATDSLPRRRTWLFMGVLFFCIVLVDTFINNITRPPKLGAKELFESYSDQLYGLRWPDDDAGGNLLDPAFDLYSALRWTKFVIVFLCAVLLVGLLIDDFRASRISQDATQRSVWRQQQAGYVVITALYIAALMPAVPDYPSAAALRSILPECGPSFNHLVQSVYGGVTGFVLTLFIIQAIVPVLTVVMPSMSRTCKMIVHAVLHPNHGDADGHGGHGGGHGGAENCCMRMVHWQPEDGPAPPAVIDHAHMLFQMSMVLSPLLIGIALLLVFVFFGNSFTLIMILVNFIGPIIVSLILSPFSIGSSYLLAVWVFYFPPLMAIFIEIGIRFHYLNLDAVLAQLSSGSFWLTVIFVIAEICIANVVVADIIYLLIWSLYPEYSVLADQLPTPFMTMGANTIALQQVGAADSTFHDAATLHRGATVASFPTMRGGMTMKGGMTIKPNRASQQIRDLDDEFGGQRYGNKAPADAPFLTQAPGDSSGSGGTLHSTPSQMSLLTSSAASTIAEANPGGMFACHICGNSYPSPNDVVIHRAKRHPEVAHLSPPATAEQSQSLY
jgi:hypothetical protein